ncbi:MAG: hypothetical protein LBD01_01805 [Puniceicoccales bacterium]|jgi:membrane-bound serine protease (ClpP class)|nr:hypothetical protein [Puniceicoccales bacterium]
MLPLAQVAQAAPSDLPFGVVGVVALMAGGLVLLGLEIVLPGAICGIIGSLLLLCGVVSAFIIGGMVGGVIALGVALAGIFLVFWFYLNVLPETRIGRKIFLDSTVSGAGASAPGDESLVGREGITQTVFVPSGLVLVDGQYYEAVSQSGFLGSGEHVVVLGRETLRLVVGKSRAKD